MTHKATKNQAGSYTYRGFTVQHGHEEMTNYYGKSATWCIRSTDEEGNVHSENAETLSQAKANIDWWIDELGMGG